MRKVLFGFFCISSFLLISFNADAGLVGTYYNHYYDHPDMQVWKGGSGMVESTLTGSAPTETSSSSCNQFDWWDSTYYAFSRVDSDSALQSGFTSSWWPVTGYSGPNEPQYFAVHWAGQFYVDQDTSYTYSMGSDDDAWLFIDNQLVLDLGGVHGMTWANYTLSLTQGYHDIEIFFAERHTVQSGFQLNFFSDLEPNPVPVPSTILVFGTGLVALAGRCSKRFK